jgi:hypothetical protein
MINPAKRCLLILLTLTAMETSGVASAAVYPVPDGIALNPDFSVRINDGNGWVPVPVQDIVDSCFIHFETTGAVDVEITVNQAIRSHQISPLSASIASEIDGLKADFHRLQTAEADRFDQ